MRKFVRAIFEKNIKVSDFGLIWRPFHEYLQIKIFFKNPALWLFYLYSSLTSWKVLTAVSEKKSITNQPTNQPTNQLLPATPILQNLADAGPKRSFFKSCNKQISIWRSKFCPIGVPSFCFWRYVSAPISK